MSDKQITLIRNNDKKDWTDKEWIEEFYQFLQGNNPDSIKGNLLSLSPNDAFTVIWYLQEHFSVFPDNIEKCSKCDNLYDANEEGYYSETKLHNCEIHADEAHDNDKKFDDENES